MEKKELQNVFRNYPQPKREYLIPILQDVQELQGYISVESVSAIGQYLSLPASKIYGVATFYNQFRFNKPGQFHIQVCRGTACHVKGSANVLDLLERELNMKAGQTSRDGLFSLEVVACLGACGLAPVISVNGKFHANVGSKEIKKIIKMYRRQGVKNAG